MWSVHDCDFDEHDRGFDEYDPAVEYAVLYFIRSTYFRVPTWHVILIAYGVFLKLQTEGVHMRPSLCGKVQLCDGEMCTALRSVGDGAVGGSRGMHEQATWPTAVHHLFCRWEASIPVKARDSRYRGLCACALLLFI